MDAGDAQKDGLLRSRFLAWLLSTEDLHQIRRRSTPRRKNAGDSGDQHENEGSPEQRQGGTDVPLPM